jgi:hypothetical protein
VCLAVVQYEQIDLLGSDRPLSRTVQHGESGEIFHERFENVGHWKVQAELSSSLALTRVNETSSTLSEPKFCVCGGPITS